jgi:hypothetical protein
MPKEATRKSASPVKNIKNISRGKGILRGKARVYEGSFDSRRESIRQLFSLRDVGVGDDDAVDVLGVGQLLEHVELGVLAQAAVEGVTGEDHIFQFRQLLDFVEFLPSLDPVIADEEGIEFKASTKPLKFFDHIVGQPKFPQIAGNFLKAGQFFDHIAAEGQAGQRLHGREVDQLVDRV